MNPLLNFSRLDSKLRLEARQLLSFVASEHCGVECLHGQVWLSAAGEDKIIEAGRYHSVIAGSHVLIEAMAGAADIRLQAGSLEHLSPEDYRHAGLPVCTPLRNTMGRCLECS